MSAVPPSPLGSSRAERRREIVEVQGRSPLDLHRIPVQVPERLPPRGQQDRMRAGIDTNANGAGGAVGDDVDHLAVRLRPAGIDGREVPPPGWAPRGTEFSVPTAFPARKNRPAGPEYDRWGCRSPAAKLRY
jgi:hypothetical protein